MHGLGLACHLLSPNSERRVVTQYCIRGVGIDANEIPPWLESMKVMLGGPL
jgi:hypothetical protein